MFMWAEKGKLFIVRLEKKQCVLHLVKYTRKLKYHVDGYQDAAGKKGLVLLIKNKILYKAQRKID